MRNGECYVDSGEAFLSASKPSDGMSERICPPPITAGNYLMLRAFFNSNRSYHATNLLFPAVFLSGIFLLFFSSALSPKG